MARLPGHASVLLVIIEHTTPVRSTTADHMRFGVKIPPFPDCAAVASVAWTLSTMSFGILQLPSAIADEETRNPTPTMKRPFIECFIFHPPFITSLKRQP